MTSSFLNWGIGPCVTGVWEISGKRNIRCSFCRGIEQEKDCLLYTSNVHVAFKPQSLANTFGQYISDHGLTQLRIAETEKYAHVTFFFNGGVEAPCKNEDRALIASPKVATYDLKPEMSAYEVTDELLARLDSGKYDVVILNFANCDMVGHTGVFEAAVSAVEAVDTCLGKVVDKILSMGGRALITADHGNADQMYEPDGSPFTAHTTNPVPLLLVGDGTHTLKEGGRLADLAPTMLEMLGLPQPVSYTHLDVYKRQDIWRTIIHGKNQIYHRFCQ